MTTLQKLKALVDAFAMMDPSDAEESTRPMVEFFQMARGLGIDPFKFLKPETEAEADQQVDSLIALLFQVRGDDLPPFDLERHIRDNALEEAEPAA
jgi:hypothetical protein